MTLGRQASLVVQGGPNSGVTIDITGKPVTLGRRPDNDVVVDEATVSRRHSLIIETDSGFVLRDLNTVNGTFLNRNRISQGEHALQHGDQIRLAGSKIVLTFRQEGAGTIKMQIESRPDETLHNGTPVRESAVVASEVEDTPGSDIDVLELLQANRGSVVSRAEIARRVAPSLQDGSKLNMLIDDTIGRLRVRLGDDSENPVRLITVGEFGVLLL